jgi:hypothetical protein
MEQAVAALDSGDFVTAETRALGALGMLAAIPAEVRKEGHASGQFKFSETMIGDFLNRIRSLRSIKKGSIGIQVARANLTNPRCGEGCGNGY